MNNQIRETLFPLFPMQSFILSLDDLSGFPWAITQWNCRRYEKFWQIKSADAFPTSGQHHLRQQHDNWSF